MLQKIASFILFRIMGWKVIGDPPREKKFLLVGLPHTSNWDFLIAWLAVTAMDLGTTIFAKDVYHTWPLNYFCKMFGVLPVNRRESTGFVDSVAQQYIEADTLRSIIAPEGTRKYTPNLKSGYYFIAKKAGIPLVVAGPNYEDKTYVFMPARKALETYEEDEQDLISFCKNLRGKHPENSFR